MVVVRSASIRVYGFAGMLTDGCWPLVTNEKKATPADILAANKHQPSLERRHHQLKGDQIVAPMFIHDPARIHEPY